MKDAVQQLLLRIFTSESAEAAGKPAFEHIVFKAKEMGLSGVTVIRGVMGFGFHRLVHTSSLLDLSTDLPIIIEVVDDEEKIREFLGIIRGSIHSGTATIEKVLVVSFR